MKRALVVMSLVAACLLLARDALSQTPTPSQTPTAGAREPAQDAATSSSSQYDSPAPSSAPDATTAQGSTVSDSETSGSQDAERLKIWNSPDMVQARAYVLKYSTLSKRFKPTDAETYLAKLREMPPVEMSKWLQRFKTRQANLARSAAVARAGRQMAIDHALNQHNAVERSYANIEQGQAEAALMAGERFNALSQSAWDLSAVRTADRDDQLAQSYAKAYSWIILPPWYTRIAAAASLPGNLPPGDPRNFIRGDVPGPEVIAGLEAAAAQNGAASAAAAAANGAGTPASAAAGVGPVGAEGASK